MPTDVEHLLRSALHDRVDAETVEADLAERVRSSARRRYRSTRVIGIRLAVAAVAAVAVVGIDMVVAGEPWQASAQAATVQQGVRLSDPVLRPGQYLHRRVVVTHPGIPKAQTVQDLYIPANQNDQWYSRLSEIGGDGVTTTFGVDKARNGRFDVAAAADWSYPDTAFLQALPRDPEAVLARLRTDGIRDAGRQWDVLENALMFANATPTADVRAAMLAAMASLSDVKSSNRPVTFNERAGHSLSITEWSLFRPRAELFFDPISGQVLGTRFTYGTILGQTIGNGGTESIKRRYDKVVDAVPFQ